MMHDAVVFFMLHGAVDSPRPWVDKEPVKPASIQVPVPVPGCDRHFAICRTMGIGMVPVPLRGTAPTSTSSKTRVRTRRQGMYICVPVYSNPTGATLLLGEHPPSRPDANSCAVSRLFWDSVRHCTRRTTRARWTCWGLAAAAGNPNRPMCSRPPRRSPSRAPASASSAVRWATSPGTCSTREENDPGRTRSASCGTCASSATPTGVRLPDAPPPAVDRTEVRCRRRDPRRPPDRLEVASGPTRRAAWLISLDVLPGYTAKRTVALARDAGIAVTEPVRRSPPERPGGQEHSHRPHLPVDARSARPSTGWLPAPCWPRPGAAGTRSRLTARTGVAFYR